MAWTPKPGTQKLNLPLPRRLLAALDRSIVDMRLRSGAVVSRSQVIRALIDLDETKRKAKPRRK